MAERPSRVLSGLTGLLVLAGVNATLGERGVDGIASAYAQPLGAQDEDYEGEYADEGGYADEAGEAYPDQASAAGDEGESQWSADQPAEMEEESEPAEETWGESTSEEESAPAAPQSQEERVLELIIQHTRQILPDLENHAFQGSERLRDLGANSVDRSEIVVMTLDSLGLSIPMAELARAEDIGQLARLIASRMP